MANILGISIGTRNVGIAVIRLRNLTDYRIRTFPGKWTQQKCERILEIIEAIVITNGITDITYKIPDKKHSSEGIEKLISGIEAVGQDYGLSIHQCTIDDIKPLLTNGKRSNKKVIVDVILQKYPELQKRWGGSKRAQTYNAKLFEAIACAELALRAGH
jgi:hypothetical protein